MVAWNHWLCLQLGNCLCLKFLAAVTNLPKCAAVRMASAGSCQDMTWLSLSAVEFCYRALLEELIAIAGVTKGRRELMIDLRPVGEEFDPMQS